MDSDNFNASCLLHCPATIKCSGLWDRILMMKKKKKSKADSRNVQIMIRDCGLLFLLLVYIMAIIPVSEGLAVACNENHCVYFSSNILEKT